jgi:ATP-dependent DNA ligase
VLPLNVVGITTGIVRKLTCSTAKLQSTRGGATTGPIDSARSRRALHELSKHGFILDGEVVVLDERGISHFHSLQDDLAGRRQDRLGYFVFDVLYLDGFDLREVPLILLDRKQILADLVGSTSSAARIRLSEHLEAGKHAPGD